MRATNEFVPIGTPLQGRLCKIVEQWLWCASCFEYPLTLSSRHCACATASAAKCCASNKSRHPMSVLAKLFECARIRPICVARPCILSMPALKTSSMRCHDKAVAALIVALARYICKDRAAPIALGKIWENMHRGQTPRTRLPCSKVAL